MRNNNDDEENKQNNPDELTGSGFTKSKIAYYVDHHLKSKYFEPNYNN